MIVLDSQNDVNVQAFTQNQKGLLTACEQIAQ